MAEPASRLAAAIQTWDHPAGAVDDLTPSVDPEARAGIVRRRRSPRRMEWGCLDLVRWRRFAEISIDTGVDEIIVAGDSGLQPRWRHGHTLVFHHDPRRQLGDRIGGEEKPLGAINMRRFGAPAFALRGGGVEDGPDRTAAIMTVGNAGQRCVHPVDRAILCSGCITIVTVTIILDLIVIVSAEVALGLVMETLAEHVDGDDVLPVAELQSGGARLVEDRTAGLPEAAVVVLAADQERLGQDEAELAGLIVKTP